MDQLRYCRLIDASNLTKKLGDTTVADSLTFHVDEGEVSGFLGSNDAEKMIRRNP